MTMTPEELQAKVEELTNVVKGLEDEKSRLVDNNQRLLSEKKNAVSRGVSVEDVMAILKQGQVPERMANDPKPNPDTSALLEQLLEARQKAHSADLFEAKTAELEKKLQDEAEKAKGLFEKASTVEALKTELETLQAERDEISAQRDTLHTQVENHTKTTLFEKAASGRLQPGTTEFLLSQQGLGPFLKLDSGELKVQGKDGNPLMTEGGKEATVNDLLIDTGPNGQGKLTGGLNFRFCHKPQPGSSDLSQDQSTTASDDGLSDEDRRVLSGQV